MLSMVYSCGIFNLGHGLFSSFFRFCSLGLSLVLTGVWVHIALLGFLVRLRLGSMIHIPKSPSFFSFTILMTHTNIRLVWYMRLKIKNYYLKYS